jgi:hypothetical protein
MWSFMKSWCSNFFRSNSSSHSSYKSKYKSKCVELRVGGNNKLLSFIHSHFFHHYPEYTTLYLVFELETLEIAQQLQSQIESFTSSKYPDILHELEFHLFESYRFETTIEAQVFNETILKSEGVVE